jgi:hypothetical protein
MFADGNFITVSFDPIDESGEPVLRSHVLCVPVSPHVIYPSNGPLVESPYPLVYVGLVLMVESTEIVHFIFPSIEISVSKIGTTLPKNL